MTCVYAGGNSEVEYRDAMQDDPQRRRPDITRAKNYIGWQPQVSLMTSFNLSPLVIG